MTTEPPTPAPGRKLPWAWALAGLAVAALILALILRGAPLHVWVHRASDALAWLMTEIGQAGPWVFFGAMILLPAVGAPLSAFTILAGEIFAPRMTMPGVITAVLTCIGVNLALTYWLARYALRPVLSRFVARYGYTVPRVAAGDAVSITMLARLTPGPPYFLQSYLLGLAEVPFRTYLVVSWLCLVPYAGGAVILGRGILGGNFREAAMGLFFIALTVAVVHFLRRKYGRRPETAP